MRHSGITPCEILIVIHYINSLIVPFDPSILENTSIKNKFSNIFNE